MKIFPILLILFFIHSFKSSAQWTQLNVPNSNYEMRTIFFKNSNEGFVAGSERIRRTLNGGTTWDTTDYGIYWGYLMASIIEKIHFVNNLEGIAAGWSFFDNSELIIKTHDGGATWTSIVYQGPFGSSIRSMYFINASSGMCVGDHGRILVTNDAGETWGFNNSGTTNNLYGVYFTASAGFVVGEGIILKTTNLGSSWTSQSFPNETFNDVYFINANTGYAVGDHIFKTTDGGTTWNQIQTSAQGTFNEVFAVNVDTIFIASSQGLLKSNNQGATWLLQTSLPEPRNFLGVRFQSTNTGYAVNSVGEVFKTTACGDPVPRNDAGVTSIIPLPPLTCQGTVPVNVTIRNFGQANLTQARINWSVNGIAQTPFNWAGNLAFDSTSAPFSIGSYNFSRGSYPIVAYTTQANSLSDYIHRNDTATGSYNFTKLKGPYTIGGAAPDFPDVISAVSALNSYGTCGNVQFKIRNGTYSGLVSIGNFYKTNVSDSVYFYSESGDSSQVTISNSGNVLQISNRVTGVSFDRISFSTSGSSTVVALTDSVSRIIFTHCAIRGSGNGTGMYHTGKASTSLVINACRFTRCNTGLSLSTTGINEVADGVSIERCVFDSISQTGISLDYAKNISIRYNTIAGATTGLIVNSCNNGFLVTHNKITALHSSRLLSITSCNNAPGAEGIVANNFISMQDNTTSGATCVNLSGSRYIQFYYNTINTNSDFGFSIRFSDTLTYPKLSFVNNIITNRKKSPVFEISGPSVISDYFYSQLFQRIDHNIYYNLPGNTSTYSYRFSTLGDFNDWKTTFPSDTSSRMADPQIMDYTDPHIYLNTTNYLISNRATPIAGFTTDIDNTNRSASSPDVGCDEFNSIALDASPKRFLNEVRICPGVNPVSIKISNYGTTTLTSATIHWSVNGIAQPNVTFNGTLTSGDSSSAITLGSFNFISGTTYTIKSWTTNPNGGSDANPINDTVTTDLLAKGMSGIYTIGGASPDYTGLTQAINDLNTNGLCGPVILNIRPGTYNETVTIPAITGSSLLNTITIQSENGDSTSVVIWNNTNHLFTIDGASFINFYRLTTIDSSAVISPKSSVYLKNRAHHITISNSLIRSYVHGFSIWSDGMAVNNINIDRNIFTGGYQAIHIDRNGSGFEYNEQLTITNNRFNDQTQEAIVLKKGSTVTIDHNISRSYLNFSGSNYGYEISAGKSKLTVTNNMMDLRNITHGMYISQQGQVNDKNIIANNMISNQGPYTASCFFITSVTNTRILFNSAFIDSSSSYNRAFEYSGEQCEINNNIFVNLGTGSAVEFYNNELTPGFDYNVYYTPNSLPFSFAGHEYDLPGWQTFSGMDTHSVYGNPSYVSAHDLHSTGSFFSFRNGINIAGMTKDIDGDLRSVTNPCIGADEFNMLLQANDAGVVSVQNQGIVCPGANPVFVKIKNYGSSALTSAKINWSIDGVAQPIFNWSGTIASLATSGSIQIGTYNFPSNDSTGIVCWTTLPNNNTDIVSSNDTAVAVNIFSKLSGSYTIGGAAPDFLTISSAVERLKSRGICSSVTFNIRTGNYNESITLPEISGASAVNTITFQSELLDSTAVSLGSITLNGLDYSQFQNLGINGITINNGSDHNEFTRNRITGDLSCKSSNTLIEENYSTNRFIFSATSSLPAKGNIVRKNLVLSGNGMRFEYQDSLLVEKNNIYYSGGLINGSSAIFMLGSPATYSVIKNRINGSFSRALDISQNGLTSQSALIANNIVTAGPATVTNVHFQVDKINFIYNTMFVPSGNTTHAAENVSSDNYNYIQNNQFINYGTNWSYYWGSFPSSVRTVSDYNNYFANGPTLINLAVFTNYPDLASFISAHPGYDTHSTNVDPQFSSNSNVYPANPAARGTGIPLTLVTDDINDSPRDPVHPSMGAMELPPAIVHDSTSKDIVVTLLNDSLLPGLNTIKVKVKNSRPFTPDSALHLFEGIIDTLFFSYSVNGAATVQETWTGSLALNDSLSYSFLQLYNVPRGRMYSVHIEVKLPAGYTALSYSNDTLTKEIGYPMSGVYTIGGFNPDFSTLSEAHHNRSVVSANGGVTYALRTGVSDSVRFAIYPIQFASLPVTYTSESGNAADAAIVLEEVQGTNIHFNNLTLKTQTNTDYMYFYKGCEFIGIELSVDSCLIRGSTSTLRRNGLTFVRSDSISVTNCRFEDLDNAIVLSDYTYFGSNRFDGPAYLNNNVFDSVQNCIRILCTFYDTLKIERNTMNQPDLGIHFQPDGYVFKTVISKNNIINATSYVLSAYTGGMSSFNMDNNMLGGRLRFYHFNRDTVNFNFNSVNGILNIEECGNFHMHNNSIANYGTGVAMTYTRMSTSTGPFDSDHNCYFAASTPNFMSVSPSNSFSIQCSGIGQLSSVTGAEFGSMFADPGYVSNSDLHSRGIALNNAGKPVAGLTTDLDDELRNPFRPDIGADEFSVGDSLTWPGDANYDGIANNYDLLSIGLYFNQTGVARVSQGNAWAGAPSSNWGSLQYCGFDKKHADCNGDGIINYGDTVAIKQNWGQRHMLISPRLSNNTEPDLHFVTISNSYAPGDTVEAELWLGDSLNQISALYGISFDVAFPPAMVQANSMSLTFPPSWIGTENINAITTASISSTASGSIVRITGTDTSGYGMFAKLQFVIEPTLTSTANFNLNFSNYTAITAAGSTVIFNPVSDSMLVGLGLNVESVAPQKSLRLFPNPAKDEFRIVYQLQKSSAVKIEMVDATGRSVVLAEGQRASGINQQVISLDRNKFSRGVYLVRIITEGSILVEKLAVE